MTMHARSGVWVGALGVALAACAAPAPTPVAPPAASPASVLPEPATLSAPEAGTASEPAVPPVADTAPTPPQPPEPETIEKPSRPPVEILTGPDTAFLIDYSGSAPLEAARKTCSERSSADDEAIAKCMSDARASFKADVLRFRQDGAHWSCVIYKREGSRLEEVYSARVELTEASPSTVKLKFTGAEKGVRVLLKAKRDAEIEVPNDYSFVLTDPELGRLVYEAKIGLIGN
jgi:hypothetical protein